MIDTTVTTNKGVENAEKNLEQAKHRLASEKKKANDARRKIENRHKYMMGGVVHKFFPECYSFEEDEMNEILKAALATQECRNVINGIKARAKNVSNISERKEVVDHATSTD